MANSYSPTAAHGPSKGHILGSAGGIIAGITGFMYAYSFLVMRDAGHASIWLLISALASSAALVTLYSRVQATDPTIALWALLLGVTGAIGSAVHGGYDLAHVMDRTSDIPRGLTWLAALLALLSLDLYIGRLTVLEPTSPIIAYPAILAGFLVNPVWYLWLGIVLWRHEA